MSVGLVSKSLSKIIIQCCSPLNMTVEQCRKIISCCLLCPCIMDKVRKLNTADSTGCLCPMETCSFETCSVLLYTLLLHTAVTSWMLRHIKQPALFLWGQCEALCHEHVCACTVVPIHRFHSTITPQGCSADNRELLSYYILQNWKPVLDCIFLL